VLFQNGSADGMQQQLGLLRLWTLSIVQYSERTRHSAIWNRFRPQEEMGETLTLVPEPVMEFLYI
jgi:hypothetical protein